MQGTGTNRAWVYRDWEGWLPHSFEYPNGYSSNEILTFGYDALYRKYAIWIRTGFDDVAFWNYFGPRVAECRLGNGHVFTR